MLQTVNPNKMATTSKTTTNSAPTPYIIRNIDDLNELCKDILEEPIEEIFFEMEEEPSSNDAASLVETFKSVIPRLERLGLFGIKVDANFNWRASYARDFMLLIAGIPSLKHFVWTCKSKCTSSSSGNNNQNSHQIPITHLAILLENCPGLERLRMEGVHFITSTIIDRPNLDGSFSMYSRTVGYLCDTFKDHPSLRELNCLHCTMSEATSSVTQTESNKNQRQLTGWWVDEMLKYLAFLQSLECIYIIAPPETNTPGRILLGLCKHGSFSEQAMEQFQTILRESQPQQALFQKVRLWTAPTYQRPTREDDSQLLLGICGALAHNTNVQDFRVRGSGEERFLTPNVMKAFRELLGSSGRPGNFTLTSCDLMQKQGPLIDFYCEMNRMGRGGMWQRLPTMTRQQWVEDILIQYHEDLDVLYYWNRVYPVFLSWLASSSSESP